MNRENISRLILDAGNGDEEWAIIAKQLHKHFPDELEAFAALVASAERERIKQANAPEIERINAHIKELEDVVIAERSACAKQLDALGCDHCAEAIRARGQA